MTSFARAPTSVFSRRALARLRGIEAIMGQPFEHMLRHPAALRATAPRKHKITDRAVRKAAMRAFTPSNPFREGLTPHLHSFARFRVYHTAARALAA